MNKNTISTLLSLIFVGSVYAQTAPTAPTQASAPTITEQSTTRFSAGVTSALGNSTTNIIYLEQTGNAPTISINQDGNSNRAGSDATGTINSMILNGNTQVVTIDQTGNNNIINTLKITGDDADVYMEQTGNSNTANISCGLTTGCSPTATYTNIAAIDMRFVGDNNSVNYTGNGPAVQAAVYVTGDGNTLALQQTSTAGQQMLINLTGDNNTVNALQTSASLSSLVLTQTGTGGATFNISQTGTYSNVANIQAVAAGGSFNIIQKSH